MNRNFAKVFIAVCGFCAPLIMVGTVAQLDETQDLTFQQDRIGHAGEQYAHHHGDFDKTKYDQQGQIHLLNPFGWSRAPGWS